MTASFLCFSALATMLASIAPAAKVLVSLLEARYKSAHTLQTTFLERYTENGRLLRVESGTAYFRRPGRMLWQYESPEKNLFLVDGKTAWFYVPADHTVMRVPAKESTDWRTPLALLAGEMKTSRVCARITLALSEKPESPDNAVLACELRGSSSKPDHPCPPDCAPPAEKPTENVFFEISRSTGDLVRVLIRDPGGVTIEFYFTNWKTNPTLDDALFRFHAPPGVAIVNAEVPSGQSSLNP